MKQKKWTKAVAWVLVSMMILSMLPLAFGTFFSLF